MVRVEGIEPPCDQLPFLDLIRVRGYTRMNFLTLMLFWTIARVLMVREEGHRFGTFLVTAPDSATGTLAWKARVLLLNYAVIFSFQVVLARGFEPPTGFPHT